MCKAIDNTTCIHTKNRLMKFSAWMMAITVTLVITVWMLLFHQSCISFCTEIDFYVTDMLPVYYL